jgi:hypothetical protein
VDHLAADLGEEYAAELRMKDHQRVLHQAALSCSDIPTS